MNKYVRLSNALTPLFSFIIYGDASFTDEDGLTKIKIEKLNNITAYQVYNQFYKVVNKERLAFDLKANEFNQFFNLNINYKPTIVLEKNYENKWIGVIKELKLDKCKLTFYVEKSSINNSSSYSLEWPEGNLDNIRIQIDPASTLNKYQ